MLGIRRSTVYSAFEDGAGPSLLSSFQVEPHGFFASRPLESITPGMKVESGILRLAKFWSGAQTTVLAIFRMST